MTVIQSQPRDQAFYAPGDSFIVASYDFEDETDSTGWYGVDITSAPMDTFFHVDVIPGWGSKSLWCGTMPSADNPLCNYATLPGYGNSWTQYFESVAFPISGTGGIDVSYDVQYDLEPGFDYGYFEFSDSNDVWITWWTYTGTRVRHTENFPLPTDGLGSEIKFRFVVDSDIAFSDEDGEYDSDYGAMIIDELTIFGRGLNEFQNFEVETLGARSTADGHWTAKLPRWGFGDFSGVVDGDTVLQEDPSITNTTQMWGFFNGSTDDYACGGFPNQPVVPYGPDEDGLYINNEIWSPAIDWTRDTTGTPIPSEASGVMLEYDVYGDMQLSDRILSKRGRVRSKVAGCWGSWSEQVLSLFSEKQWYRFREDITDLIDPGADTIQVSLGCMSTCPYFCEPGEITCQSHGPLFDNIRVVRFRPPVCQVTPTSLDFGMVTVGDSLDKTFTITNTATSGVLSGTVHESCSDYSIVSEAYYSLAGGQSQDFTVRFKPTGIGSHICTVETWDGLCSDVACTGEGVCTSIYVDADATGSGTGTSWTDAFTDLQDALANRASWPCAVEEIWVAEGMYTPTDSTDREATFQLQDSLAIYGGFAGTETTLGERDWTANVTILSGDIGVVADSTDNSYHVVRADSTDSSAVLDGFTVTRGTADGTGADANGGGIYNLNGQPILNRVVISNNTAAQLGGGIYSEGVPTLNNPTLNNVTIRGNTARIGGGMYDNNGASKMTNVAFANNDASQGGGGLYSLGASERLTNVVFSQNSAGWYGGGIAHDAGSLVLTNLAFYGNSGGSGGGAIDLFQADSLTVVNSILWGNGTEMFLTGSPFFSLASHSLIQGGVPPGVFDGGNNIDADPMFVNVANGDLRLWSSSPAIEAGDNAAVPPGVTTDRDGNPRLYGTDVDMGAYEYQGLPTGIDDDWGNSIPSTFALHQNVPNPFNPTTVIHYDVPGDGGQVTLQVYDVAGRLVRTLVDGVETPGAKRVTWNGLNSRGNRVATGVYFYKMTAAGFTNTRKMVLLQ
jgi:predicted outer membrane repeat protein